jgi:hypothetical protein
MTIDPDSERSRRDLRGPRDELEEAALCMTNGRRLTSVLE